MNRKIQYTPSSLFLLLLFMLAFASCKKEETIFEKSPDERLNETLTKLESALTGSAPGWKATLRTRDGGLYNFHFRFNNSNRTFMFSDFNLETASTQRESSYRLKALQTPSLLFDTYSYLHMLADPDASVNGGQYGQGLATDFEFALDSLAADSIMLTGRMNGTKLTLKKATQAELDAWQNGRWATTVSFENINLIQNYFKRIIINGITYEIRVDPVTRTVTFTWVNGSGSLQQISTPYYYSATGVVFVNPFTAGNQTISGFEIVSWNASTSVLDVKVNGADRTISGATQPLKIDLGAPQRWWQASASSGDYWISINGFHVNGVDDAFGVRSLTNGSWSYYFLLYWAGVTASNDFFGPVFIDADRTTADFFYGTAPRPTFTSDGRAVFVRVGDYGPPNFLAYPSSGPAALTRAQLYNASGYYFVQTSATSYDMVSATDAKAWISWTF